MNDVSSTICKTIDVDNKNGYGRAVFVDIKRKDATSGRCKPRDINSFFDQLERQNNNHYHNHSDNDNTQGSSLDDDDNDDQRVTFHELEQFDQWRDVMTFHQLDHHHHDKMDSTATTATTTKHFSKLSYDAIIIDVGTMIGNDLHLTALSIANEIIAHHNHNHNHNHHLRIVIIKSKLLSNLARRIIHSQRLFDGSVSLPKPEDILRSSTPFIIASVGVNEYRRTIPYMVKSGDKIIEVGCHFGQTTALLYEAATSTTGSSDSSDDNDDDDTATTISSSSSGFCIGVDIGPKIIKHAKMKYPHVPFVVGNAWNILQLLKVRYSEEIHESKHQKINDSTTSVTPLLHFGYDLVYADIGGLSGADGLMESLSLLESIGHGIEPRGIVIKSLCMNRLASQLRAFSDVWSRIEKIELSQSEIN